MSHNSPRTTRSKQNTSEIKNTSNTSSKAKSKGTKPTTEEFPELKDKSSDEIIILVYKEVRHFRDQLLKIETQLELLEERDKINSDLINELQGSSKNNDKKLRALEETVEKMQINSRKRNIIIHGVDSTPTTAADTPFKIASRFLNSTLKVDPKQIHIAAVKKLGKTNTAPLLLTLGCESQKQHLQSLYKNLKGTNISVTNDLTPTQLEGKKLLLGRRREAIDSGAKLVKVYDDSIQIDGEWFDLKASKIVKRNDTHPRRAPTARP